MPRGRKSSLTTKSLEKMSQDELNEYIKKAAKILNDRERYLEVVSGMRIEASKRMTTAERARNLEISDALMRISNKAKELNRGGKVSISKGGSARFSGARSRSTSDAFLRASEMKNLIEGRFTKIAALEKNLLGRMEGISIEIWGDKRWQRLKGKEWDLLFGFFELADKYGFPSDVVFDYVIKPQAQGGQKLFRSMDQFEKWIKIQQKKSSVASLEADLQKWQDKIRFRSSLTAAQMKEMGLYKYNDVIDDFWSTID